MIVGNGALLCNNCESFLLHIRRMKEISVTDKAELNQLQKQFKEVSNQLTEISEERDKLENDLRV